MKFINMIREIIQMDIEKGFKRKMLFLGCIEALLGAYKLLIKLPVYLFGLPFNILHKIGEFVADICMEIMWKVDELPDVVLVKKEDRDILIKKIKEKCNKKVLTK